MAKIGVVGAGLMGAEIALVFALAEHDVLLNDKSQESLDHALQRLRVLLEKGVKRDLYTQNQVESTLKRITPTVRLSDFSDREVVTEAVFEDREVKASILKTLEEICSSECLILTNTSTFPIAELATNLAKENRGRFVGTHYFSPVSRMQLVEVIPGFDTSMAAFERVMELMKEIGKTPIKVKDVAGFAINRVLHQFIIESVRLVEEGVCSPEDLNTACKLGLGHPLGPFELLDLVTSSLTVQSHEIMYEAYGERFRTPPLMKNMVKAGYVGGKGKPGWKDYMNFEH